MLHVHGACNSCTSSRVLHSALTSSQARVTSNELKWVLVKTVLLLWKNCAAHSLLRWRGCPEEDSCVEDPIASVPGWPLGRCFSFSPFFSFSPCFGCGVLVWVWFYLLGFFGLGWVFWLFSLLP